MNKLFYYFLSSLALFLSLPALASGVDLTCSIGVAEVSTIWNKSSVAQDLESKIALMNKELSDKTKRLEQVIKNEEKELDLILKKKRR
jgi:hypothetical protein